MKSEENIREYNRNYESFVAHYNELAKISVREERRMMNHLCVRVDDIDSAEQFLSQSFGISNFIRVNGKLFKGEKKLSVAWVSEEMYLELMQPEEQQELGYETGCGHPIGHLSEVGYFIPDMDRELERLSGLGWKVTDAIEEPGRRMIKIDTGQPSGFPVELIEVTFSEEELQSS